jgi:hypothetical protein
MADAKKTTPKEPAAAEPQPKEIAGTVEEGGAPLALGEALGAPLPPVGDETPLALGEALGAPLPPVGDETPLPVAPAPAAPPVVSVTKGENGTVTNQIGGG